MEVAILLAHAQENLAHTTFDPTQSTPGTDTNTDLDDPKEEEVDGDSAQTTPTAAPTPKNTSAMALLPWIDYNIVAAADTRKMEHNSTPPPAAATIHHHTLAWAPLPPVDYNTRATPYTNDTTNPNILT